MDKAVNDPEVNTLRVPLDSILHHLTEVLEPILLVFFRSNIHKGLLKVLIYFNVLRWLLVLFTYLPPFIQVPEVELVGCLLLVYASLSTHILEAALL